MTVAKDLNQLVSPVDVHDTKQFAGFGGQSSVCASLGTVMVKGGLANIRRVLAEIDSQAVAARARHLDRAHKGLCIVSMKPCYVPYVRADATMVTRPDLCPWNYRACGEIMHHFFVTARVSDMTTLEALVATFCWYYAGQIIHDARGEQEDEVPFHIRYHYVENKGVFALFAAQVVEVNIDMSYHVNHFLFGVATSDEFNLISKHGPAAVEGMVSEHLRHRPTLATNPTAKASAQHSRTVQSRDGVKRLVEDADPGLSSVIGTES